MNTPFSHVTILGGGLLGGSLALALQQLGSAPVVRLWARREDTVQEAATLGIAGATADLAEAVATADLLVLAVPVGAMASLLQDAMEAGLPAGCLVTDVGSVKGMPHQALGPLLQHAGHTFIGSHPMAGSEQGGIQASKADLFDGAACLLTNDGDGDEQLAKALESFWQQVGCRTVWLTAADHDALVARISHLPHILAAAAARTCLENPEDGVFGGGGLRDTTRVAAGNPVMWTEILMENRQALTRPLQQSIDDLGRLLEILRSGDQEATRQWLEAAKDRRDCLP